MLLLLCSGCPPTLAAIITPFPFGYGKRATRTETSPARKLQLHSKRERRPVEPLTFKQQLFETGSTSAPGPGVGVGPPQYMQNMGADYISGFFITRCFDGFSAKIHLKTKATQRLQKGHTRLNKRLKDPTKAKANFKQRMKQRQNKRPNKDKNKRGQNKGQKENLNKS